MDIGIAICILFHRSQQVFAGILVQRFIPSTGDVDSAAQLVGHRVVATFCHRLVSAEVEALAQSFKAADGDVAVT